MEEPTADRGALHSATRAGDAPHGPAFNLAALLRRVAAWGLFDDRSFPEFSDLVIAARHCAGRVCVFGLAIAAVCAAIASVFFPATYEAVSYVQVRRHDNLVFSEQVPQQGDEFILRQEQRVLAKPVLDAALERSEVAPFVHHVPNHESIAWLRKRIRVDLQAGAELMSISFTHASPDIALAFNTAVTNAYVDDYLRTITNDRQRQLLELERAAKQADHVLNEYWIQLQSLADQVGSSSTEQLTMRDQIELQSYREYAQQLRSAQGHGRQLRSRLAEAQLQLTKVLPAPQIEAVVQRQPELVRKRAECNQLDAQIEQLKKVVSRQDTPRLTNLQATRNLLADEITLLVEQLRQTVQRELVDRQREIHAAQVEQISRQIELNADEVAATRDVLAQLETQIERTGENNGARLEMLRRTIDRQTRLTDGLWRALETRKIEAQALPRVALLESARRPQFPDRRQQLKVTFAAGVGGLLLSILVLGYLEWRSCRVRQPHDVVLRTGLTLFGLGHFARGASPWWQSQRGRRNVMLSGINDVVACAARKSSTLRPKPVIFVSSATESEPRHIASIELALGFSRTGLRTLLIDTDVEGTRLARHCGLRDEPGLLQLGDDAAGDPPSVLRTTVANLNVLPKGPYADDSVGRVPRALAIALERLLDNYDAVVVHGPPILTTPDSVLIASRVNAAVFAAEMGHSRWNLLSAARQRLAYAGIELLGAVLCNSHATTLAVLAQAGVEEPELAA